MANIKNMNMGTALLRDARISTSTSFFGMVHKYIYTPTGSRLQAYCYEYPASMEPNLAHLLTLRGDALTQAAKDLRTLRSDTLGNLRLEVCVTADSQMAALQLFRYTNFVATPLSNLTIYEGADAATIAALL